MLYTILAWFILVTHSFATGVFLYHALNCGDSEIAKRHLWSAAICFPEVLFFIHYLFR